MTRNKSSCLQTFTLPSFLSIFPLHFTRHPTLSLLPSLFLRPRWRFHTGALTTRRRGGHPKPTVELESFRRRRRPPPGTFLGCYQSCCGSLPSSLVVSIGETRRKWKLTGDQFSPLSAASRLTWRNSTLPSSARTTHTTSTSASGSLVSHTENTTQRRHTLIMFQAAVSP